MLLYIQRPCGLLGTGSPGRPPRLSHSSWASILLYVHRDHKDYQGSGAQDVHLDFHTLSSEHKRFVQCCFTSTETIRTIRDGEPRTATSIFTHWALKPWKFSVALRPQRLYGLLGTGSPGRPPRLSRSSWVLPFFFFFGGGGELVFIRLGPFKTEDVDKNVSILL